MITKKSPPPGDYAVGKGRPPLASRWKKGQSGNPRGNARRPPDEAELIDQLFRRSFAVNERGEIVNKMGFAIIHAQLLNKESMGDRRAGRTRDRYEAFARADASASGVLLRFVECDQAPNSATRAEPAPGEKSQGENGAPSADASDGDDASVLSADSRRDQS